MEIFSGFLVMVSIFGFFLAVIWFVLPFVVFAMKGKQDRACELLEQIDRRLAGIEERLNAVAYLQSVPAARANGPDNPPSGEPPSSGEE